MKILVVGAGGIGGFFGGLLAQSGNDVTFIARGEHGRAILTNGLLIKSRAEEFRIFPTKVTASPKSDLKDPFDLVLHATKSNNLEEAAADFKHLVAPRTDVLFTQNGIDIFERLSKIIPARNIIPGSVQIVSEISAPGEITQHSKIKKITFGELDQTQSQRCRALETTFQSADIEFSHANNIASELWNKFIFINAFSGMTALSGQPIGAILADSKLRTMFRSCLMETFNLAIKMNVQMPESLVEEKFQFTIGLEPNLSSSMQRDFEQKKPTEIESLNGAVCKLARIHGVPAPVNQLIYDRLTAKVHSF